MCGLGLDGICSLEICDSRWRRDSAFSRWNSQARGMSLLRWRWSQLMSGRPCWMWKWWLTEKHTEAWSELWRGRRLEVLKPNDLILIVRDLLLTLLWLLLFLFLYLAHFTFFVFPFPPAGQSREVLSGLWICSRFLLLDSCHTSHIRNSALPWLQKQHFGCAFLWIIICGSDWDCLFIYFSRIEGLLNWIPSGLLHCHCWLSSHSASCLHMLGTTKWLKTPFFSCCFATIGRRPQMNVCCLLFCEQNVWEECLGASRTGC